MNAGLELAPSARRLNSRALYVVAAALSLAVASFGIYAASSRSLAAPPSGPAGSAAARDSESDFQWGPVERATFSSGVSVTGRVIPQDGALAVQSARVQGRILSILRREGERVAKGDRLFSVSSGECSSLAAEKQVAAKGALQDLVDGVAKRERELGLRLEGDQCFVVASESGVIAKRSVEAGAAFNPGDSLANILDVRRLAIELDVPEHELARVKARQAVSVSFASDPTKRIKTEIATLLPAIDSSTRAAKARLKPVPLPAGANLEALVFGEIDTGQAVERLQVPSSALVFSRNQLYVIKGPKESLKPVAVNVINENDKDSVIQPVVAGELKEKDEVAVKGGIYLLRKLQRASGAAAAQGSPQ